MKSHTWITILFAVCLANCFTAPSLAQDRGEAEYKIKAAFVINFMKYVEWPSKAHMSSSSVITLCIAGENPFVEHMNRLEGKTVQNKSVALKLSSLDAAQSCDVLFISASERERVTDKLPKVRKLPVLTIGDTEGFAAKGVMINMYMDGEKVRFEINLDAAERTGLKMSSQLLKLARIVKESTR